MRLSAVSRIVGIAAVLALAASTLAVPAVASPVQHADTAQDPTVIAVIMQTAQSTCRTSGTAPANLQPVYPYYELVRSSPDSEAVIASVDVLDGNSAYQTCSFALFRTARSSYLSGQYRLSVALGSVSFGERADSIMRNRSGGYATTAAVFSPIDYYTTATLMVTDGKKITPVTSTVTMTVKTPKTKAQKKVAAKRLDKAIAKAKKAYKKALKKARAKSQRKSARADRDYRVLVAKRQYRAAVATTEKVRTSVTTLTETPVTLNGSV